MLYDPDSYASYRESRDEDIYYSWLHENCKCNIDEEGCSCMNFDEFFAYRSDQAAEDRACREEECG